MSRAFLGAFGKRCRVLANDVISGKGKPDTEGAAFVGCTLGDDATAKLLH